MDKKALIDNLNHDLAEELSAVIQYTTYAAKTTGPYRPQLEPVSYTHLIQLPLH